MDINLGLSAVATGVDTITATYSPAPTLVDKKILFLRTAGTNTTTTPTFNPNGLGAQTITKNNGDALAVGDLDGDVILMYDSANTNWELLTPKSATFTQDQLNALSPTFANAPSASTPFATMNDLAGYEPSLGFTPENVANKSTSVVTDQASNTKYPSVKAVYDWANPKLVVRTSDTIRYTNTGDTNENVLTSLLITAGSYTNKCFEVYIKTITSTVANNKTFKIYFNATADLAGSPVLAATYVASTAGGTFSRKFKDLGTTLKNYIATATAFSQFESSSTSTSTENTLSVDLTSNMYIVITAQNASGTESAIIDFCYTQNLT